MKNRFITTLIIAAFVLASSVASYAQPNNGNHEDWKKKMMSEKVAFFTVELDLTPAEAQKFWPVYNQIDKERDEANAAVFMAYFELEKAIKEKKSEKEISPQRFWETYPSHNASVMRIHSIDVIHSLP